MQDYKVPFRTIRYHTGTYGTMQNQDPKDHMEAYGTKGPYMTIWEYMGPYGTIQCHTGANDTIGIIGSQG